MASHSKVALVTGAGSGIGRAASLALHAGGYSVVLAGRRIEQLNETASRAQASEGKLLVVPTDVCRPDQVRTLFATTKESFGRLDVLFNNAGINAPGIPMEDLSYERWTEVVSINLTGAFLCAQEAIRLMKTQQPRGGRIINNGRSRPMCPGPTQLHIRQPSTPSPG
jgi:NAD(P)-dependent dehydrogenase (short-subunit alcohol dehydrogenase family)